MCTAAAIFLCLFATAFASTDYGNRCFSCNYAPSGYQKNTYGWSKSTAGTELCALAKPSDAAQLDQWACKGKCFIRKDQNGLVYRGCAEQKNLPLNVNTHVQCAYQGGQMDQSLYFFCEGDLCNDGRLEDKDRCGHGYNSKYDSVCKPYACKNNPSGQFADPYNPYGFIQCGCDFKYGKACSCCRSFQMDCPKGTKWNEYQKICENVRTPHH